MDHVHGERGNTLGGSLVIEQSPRLHDVHGCPTDKEFHDHNEEHPDDPLLGLQTPFGIGLAQRAATERVTHHHSIGLVGAARTTEAITKVTIAIMLHFIICVNLRSSFTELLHFLKKKEGEEAQTDTY